MFFEMHLSKDFSYFENDLSNFLFQLKNSF